MGRMGTHPSIMPIYDLGDESASALHGAATHEQVGM